MSYAWFIRNARSGLFVASTDMRDQHKFVVGGVPLRWTSKRADAMRFLTWQGGREFLSDLDKRGPVPPGWHLIDYRECSIIQPDGTLPPAKSQKQIVDEALAADRIREAVRRAHWSIKPAVAMYALCAIALEQYASTILRGGS